VAAESYRLDFARSGFLPRPPRPLVRRRALANQQKNRTAEVLRRVRDLLAKKDSRYDVD